MQEAELENFPGFVDGVQGPALMASKVTLVHRRDAFRASQIMAERVLADPTIEIAWNSEVAQILGDDRVAGLRLRDMVTGAERKPIIAAKTEELLA